MNEVEGGVATYCRIGDVRMISLIPREATSTSLPLGFVEIIVFVAHIYVDIFIQVAV